MVILIKSLKDTLKYAGQHSPFWKERLEGKAFDEVPVLRKTDLIELQKDYLPFGGISIVAANQMARIFMSPGPIYDPQGTDGDFWRFAEALEIAGFNEHDIVQNTFSYHLSPAGFMFDTALRKVGATVIPAGIGNTELQVQIMKDVQVTGYVGTPSFLFTLLEKAKEAGYHLGKEIKLERAFFTAEKLSKELKEQWLNQGLKVYEGYGTADAGCIAYEDGEYKGLKVASQCYVELCHPETGIPVEEGEIGEVVVTLFDESYPLIRFGTGDLSSWVPDEKGKYLVGILGRVGDGVKVKGMFVHLKQILPIMEKYKEVDYYQCVVDRKNNIDNLTIFIESNGKLDEYSIQQEIKGVIRVTPEVKMVSVGTLSREEPQLFDKREWK